MQVSTLNRECETLRAALGGVEGKLTELQRRDADVRRAGPRGLGVRASLPQSRVPYPATCLGQALSRRGGISRASALLWFMCQILRVPPRACCCAKVWTRVKEAMTAAEEARLARDAAQTRCMDLERQVELANTRLTTVRQVSDGTPALACQKVPLCSEFQGWHSGAGLSSPCDAHKADRQGTFATLLGCRTAVPRVSGCMQLCGTSTTALPACSTPLCKWPSQMCYRLIVRTNLWQGVYICPFCSPADYGSHALHAAPLSPSLGCVAAYRAVTGHS